MNQNLSGDLAKRLLKITQMASEELKRRASQSPPKPQPGSKEIIIRRR